jgi:Big-like domain-containing protein
MTAFRSMLRLALGLVFVGLLYSCGGSGSNATLQSIEITPGSAKAAAGTSTQLTATGIFSDGTHENLTYQVTWSSSNSAVANVTAGGVANAVAQGSTKVSATMGTVTGSAAYNVSAAALVSIEVTPSRPSIASGMTLQFTATGIFSDNSTQNLTTQVLWSSSKSGAATVSSTAGSDGLVTTTSVGSVVISASSGTISGSTTLTITAALLSSIEVTPPAKTIPKGLTQQFTATGVFSDNSTQDLTTQVTWSSSAAAIAAVSNLGVVTASSVGTTTINASLGAVTSPGAPVTVSPAALVSIQVTPPTPRIANGLTAQFTAIGIYTDNSNMNVTTNVNWHPSNPLVATISNAAGTQGLATSLAVGSTTITASVGAVVSNSATLTVTPATLVSIAVTPPNPSVANGLKRQFIATGTYTDHTTQTLTTGVMWGSTTSAVATISNATGSQGLAASAGVGITSITATLGAVTGSTSLTVTPATLVSIQVTASNYSIAGIGQTQQFVATGTYTNGTMQDLTTQVLWSPSNAAVATISNSTNSNGLATSMAVGMTTITATLGAGANAVAGTTNLTVTAPVLISIQVTPADATVYTSQVTQQMVATGTYNDSLTNPNHPPITNSVTWTSSNANVVMTNGPTSYGVANLVSAGQTKITASLGNVHGSTMLTVSTATLASITVTATGNPYNDPNGDGNVLQQLTATGLYDDEITTVDLTNLAIWSSSPSDVVSIVDGTGAPDTGGIAKWLGLGTTSVTATYGGITSAPYSYTVAAPSSIAVTATSNTIAGIGVTQPFAAKGTYAGLTDPIILTNLVAWSSSDTTVATISSAGLATSVGDTVTTGSGSTTVITASWGGVPGTANLVVKQSFRYGSNSVYTKVLVTASMAYPVTNPPTVETTCSSGCHTPAPDTAAGVNTWYAADAGTTYDNISTDGYLTDSPLKFDICANPPTGMPSYTNTTICLPGTQLLQQWLSEGALP